MIPGALTFLMLGGKKKINLVISSNTNDYNVFTQAGSPVAGVDVTLTINSGVVVGSTSASTAAIIASGFAVGSTLTIINNGTVSGKGGQGGNGAESWSAGQAGGDAINVNLTTIIFNNGTIQGGGGGGGGCRTSYSGYSGGGGAGANVGTKGSGVYDYSAVHKPADGTLTTGGIGGYDTTYGDMFSGGNGGNAGQAGSPGASIYYPTYGQAGGAAGRYIVGNSYVTWSVTGTRLGGVA